MRKIDGIHPVVIAGMGHRTVNNLQGMAHCQCIPLFERASHVQFYFQQNCARLLNKTNPRLFELRIFLNSKNSIKTKLIY